MELSYDGSLLVRVLIDKQKEAIIWCIGEADGIRQSRSTACSVSALAGADDSCNCSDHSTYQIDFSNDTVSRVCNVKPGIARDYRGWPTELCCQELSICVAWNGVANDWGQAFLNLRLTLRLTLRLNLRLKLGIGYVVVPTKDGVHSTALSGG